MDYSPPGSSVHDILQARILAWVAISFSRGFSQHRDQTASLRSPALAGGFFTTEQPGVKEINPEYSLEGLLLKLKLQYFGNLMQRADSLEKTLMLGKIEGRRRRGQQKLRWLNGITKSIDMSLSKLWEIIKVREA